MRTDTCTHTRTHTYTYTRVGNLQNTHRSAHIHLQYTVTEVCDQTTQTVERGQCHLQARRRIYGVVKLLHFSSRPKMRCDHILRGRNSVRSARQLNLQINVAIRLTFWKYFDSRTVACHHRARQVSMRRCVFVHVALYVLCSIPVGPPTCRAHSVLYVCLYLYDSKLFTHTQ